MASPPTRRVRCTCGALAQQTRQAGQRRPLRPQEGTEPAMAREVDRGGRGVDQMSRQRSQQQRAGVFLKYIHSRLRCPWKTANALTRPSVALP